MIMVIELYFFHILAHTITLVSHQMSSEQKKKAHDQQFQLNSRCDSGPLRVQFIDSIEK